jgi:hypothetical protein
VLVKRLPPFFGQFEEKDKQPFDKLRDTAVLLIFGSTP